MSAMEDNPSQITEAEYLALEANSDIKHEFLHGEIFAMAGASREHSFIAGMTYVALINQLGERPCEVHQSEIRVKVLATGLYTYPDISVTCGEVVFTGDKPDTLLNPSLLIEVLSPSTEAHDRGKKFRHYGMIPSLSEYVLISQDSPRIERFLRQGQGFGKWDYLDVRGLEEGIELTSIACTLSLAEVYKKISFENDNL